MKSSIKTLLNQIESGRIKSDKAKILNYIRNNPYSTIPEIIRNLKIVHQTATARLSDLLDLGVIEEAGIKESENSNYTYFKYQPGYDKQITNSQKRLENKYKAWIKRGLNNYKHLMNTNLKQELQWN